MSLDSDTPHTDLRLLVLEAVQRLQDGQDDSDIASLFANHFHHPASIRMLVRKARKLQASCPLRPHADRGPADTPSHSESNRREQIGHPNLTTQDTQRRLKVPPLGLYAPFLLLSSKTLTAAEKQGLQVAAQTVYDSIVAGSERESTVRQLSTALRVDATAARNLVYAIDLHVRPVFPKTSGSAWRGRVLMVLALVLPFSIVRVARVPLASAIPDETLALLVLATLMVGYPAVRASLGQRALGWRRRNTPDGLAELASDPRKPVLYLRSHRVDGSGKDLESYWRHLSMSTELKTLEERIAASLSVVGPVVALEGPREELPNLGAARIRLTDVEKVAWQPLVQGLICRSVLVVVRFRPTQGMCWEVEQLLRLYPPNQLVFVLTEPRDLVAIREQAWDRLRPMLAGHAKGVLPNKVGRYDYFLGFDAEFRPEFFGRKSVFHGEDAEFLDALVEATTRNSEHLKSFEFAMRMASLGYR